jgi:hypothetical protein
MASPAQDWLAPAALDALAAGSTATRALPWPHEPKPGDTIWMGAADRAGTVVSFIQSVFWEFGSGLTCAETGVFFQNRGAGFALAPGPNQLRPGRRPIHTLNPALARLARWAGDRLWHDGRRRPAPDAGRPLHPLRGLSARTFRRRSRRRAGFSVGPGATPRRR